MKKKIALVLAVMMLCGLAACGEKSGVQQKTQNQANLVGRWELVDVQTD